MEEQPPRHRRGNHRLTATCLLRRSSKGLSSERSTSKPKSNQDGFQLQFVFPDVPADEWQASGLVCEDVTLFLFLLQMFDLYLVSRLQVACSLMFLSQKWLNFVVFPALMNPV